MFDLRNLSPSLALMELPVNTGVSACVSSHESGQS